MHITNRHSYLKSAVAIACGQQVPPGSNRVAHLPYVLRQAFSPVLPGLITFSSRVFCQSVRFLARRLNLSGENWQKELGEFAAVFEDQLLGRAKIISGRKVAACYSILIDAVIKIAAEVSCARHSAGGAIAIIGAGSYGRRELTANSDLDIYFFFDPARISLGTAQKVVTDIYACLEPLKLRIDFVLFEQDNHALREYRGQESLPNSKLNNLLLSLLEGGVLFGKELGVIILGDYFKLVQPLKPAMIFHYLRVLDENNLRHEDERLNLKEDHGMLRSFHTLFWVCKLYFGWEATTIPQLFSTLLKVRLISASEAKQALAHYDHCLKTRNQISGDLIPVELGGEFANGREFVRGLSGRIFGYVLRRVELPASYFSADAADLLQATLRCQWVPARALQTAHSIGPEHSRFLALNPSTPAETLRALERQNDPVLNICLAANPNSLVKLQDFADRLTLPLIRELLSCYHPWLFDVWRGDIFGYFGGTKGQTYSYLLTEHTIKLIECLVENGYLGNVLLLAALYHDAAKHLIYRNHGGIEGHARYLTESLLPEIFADFLPKDSPIVNQVRGVLNCFHGLMAGERTVLQVPDAYRREVGHLLLAHAKCDLSEQDLQRQPEKQAEVAALQAQARFLLIPEQGLQLNHAIATQRNDLADLELEEIRALPAFWENDLVALQKKEDRDMMQIEVRCGNQTFLKARVKGRRLLCEYFVPSEIAGVLLHQLPEVLGDKRLIKGEGKLDKGSAYFIIWWLDKSLQWNGYPRMGAKEIITLTARILGTDAEDIPLAKWQDYAAVISLARSSFPDFDLCTLFSLVPKIERGPGINRFRETTLLLRRLGQNRLAGMQLLSDFLLLRSEQDCQALRMALDDVFSGALPPAEFFSKFPSLVEFFADLRSAMADQRSFVSIDYAEKLAAEDSLPKEVKSIEVVFISKLENAGDYNIVLSIAKGLSGRFADKKITVWVGDEDTYAGFRQFIPGFNAALSANQATKSLQIREASKHLNDLRGKDVLLFVTLPWVYEDRLSPFRADIRGKVNIFIPSYDWRRSQRLARVYEDSSVDLILPIGLGFNAYGILPFETAGTQSRVEVVDWFTQNCRAHPDPSTLWGAMYTSQNGLLPVASYINALGLALSEGQLPQDNDYTLILTGDYCLYGKGYEELLNVLKRQGFSFLDLQSGRFVLKNSTPRVLAYAGKVPHPIFIGLLQESELPLLITGNSSLAEAIAFSKPFMYSGHISHTLVTEEVLKTRFEEGRDFLGLFNRWRKGRLNNAELQSLCRFFSGSFQSRAGDFAHSLAATHDAIPWIISAINFAWSARKPFGTEMESSNKPIYLDNLFKITKQAGTMPGSEGKK